MFGWACRRCFFVAGATCVLLTLCVTPASAQGSPTYLDDGGEGLDDGLSPELPYDGLGPSYQDMLVLSYVMGVPAAVMTAGVGLLMPVGVHYKHGNPTGGKRALAGILGGLILGATVGGLLDQPVDGFAFTAGMAYGMLGGYFTWGTIDIVFFADPPTPQQTARMAIPTRQAW